ncbi:MAG: transcription initiation factor subunit alpha [Candidatus Woesearchaeota archaeon]|nr:transcription initiation factor subunit alpha [Candidatus Woesearchaeota archaeon]
MEINQELEDKVISLLCGEDTLPIMHFLKGKVNVSEFEIAEALKLDLNVMRNQLYRLQQYNLLKFKRKKDKQKGWYIYYWTADFSNIPYLYLQILKDELARVESRLEREKNNFFYSCENRCMRLSFEQAMDFNFTCPECGLIMNEINNDDIIKMLEEKREKLIKEIDEFENKVIPEWKRKQTVAPEKELPKKRRSKQSDEDNELDEEGAQKTKVKTSKKTKGKEESKRKPKSSKKEKSGTKGKDNLKSVSKSKSSKVKKVSKTKDKKQNKVKTKPKPSKSKNSKLKTKIKPKAKIKKKVKKK